MADSRPEDAGNGALFKNDRKEKPSHPDYKGDAMIRGKKMWISAWLKTKADGSKYMSLAFREADETAAKPKPKPVAVATEEIPFFRADR